MDVGDITTYEAWVLRDCVWQVFSTGFCTVEDVRQQPLRHGYTPDRVQVVQVRRVRTVAITSEPRPDQPAPGSTAPAAASGL